MKLKDKIWEIIATVYSFGSNKYENDLKVKDVATDRIMKLVEEERHLTSAMHSDGEGRCEKCQTYHDQNRYCRNCGKT